VAQVAVARGRSLEVSDRGGTSNPYNPHNVFTDRAGALHLPSLNEIRTGPVRR
jgi:hypothetical protein